VLALPEVAPEVVYSDRLRRMTLNYEARLRTLRAEGSEFAAVKIYTCPMTNRAFEGAPRTAQWVQLAPPLRNPYFGDDMLECGREIQ
jgi:hypothetical protein